MCEQKLRAQPSTHETGPVRSTDAARAQCVREAINLRGRDDAPSCAAAAAAVMLFANLAFTVCPYHGTD